MTTPQLTPGKRYRCNGCGNLTRFDVTMTRYTKAFYHYTTGGQLDIEDEEVLAAVYKLVICRWCGSDRQIQVIDALVDTDQHPGDSGK